MAIEKPCSQILNPPPLFSAPLQELFRMIQAKPLARDLFVAWTRQNDPDALKKYFFTTGNPAAAAEVLVKESYQVRPLLLEHAPCLSVSFDPAFCCDRNAVPDWKS
jgi:hypothetical protein